jgi:hypothetical protein
MEQILEIQSYLPVKAKVQAKIWALLECILVEGVIHNNEFEPISQSSPAGI